MKTRFVKYGLHWALLRVLSRNQKSEFEIKGAFSHEELSWHREPISGNAMEEWGDFLPIFMIFSKFHEKTRLKIQVLAGKWLCKHLTWNNPSHKALKID